MKKSLAIVVICLSADAIAEHRPGWEMRPSVSMGTTTEQGIFVSLQGLSTADDSNWGPYINLTMDYDTPGKTDVLTTRKYLSSAEKESRGYAVAESASDTFVLNVGGTYRVTENLFPYAGIGIATTDTKGMYVSPGSSDVYWETQDEKRSVNLNVGGIFLFTDMVGLDFGVNSHRTEINIALALAF